MNICAKINSKARPNGLVIGETLFDIVKDWRSTGLSLLLRNSSV
jgi:hypothetical protein